MSRFRYHLFICANQRPPDNPKGCCAASGAEEFLDRFRSEIKRLGLNKTTRVNKAGCLDACSHGPCMVVYPEGIWYRLRQEEDVQEILESHIRNGRPVERLVIQDL